MLAVLTLFYPCSQARRYPLPLSMAEVPQDLKAGRSVLLSWRAMPILSEGKVDLEGAQSQTEKHALPGR